MTQKDLLYIEDAIGHQNNLEALWENFASLIEDEEALGLIKSEMKRHSNIREKIMKVLKEAANE